MKLYRISVSTLDDIYFIKNSIEDVLESFKDSIDEDEYEKYSKDKSFKCIEVNSLEHFISLVNHSEFTLDPDTVVSI